MKKLALALAIGLSAFIAVATSGTAVAAQRCDNYSRAGAIVDGRVGWSAGGMYSRLL